jgi:hypothetical protein
LFNVEINNSLTFRGNAREFMKAVSKPIIEELRE